MLKVLARSRVTLLTSAATMSLVLGGTAHAANDTPGAPETVIHEAQGGGNGNSVAAGSYLGTGNPDTMINTPAIVASPPDTPGSIVDTTNVTGVGQLVTDERNGFLGLCTATLINPRTVIFAAHCVGENPAGTGYQNPWDYGTANGGLPISIGFAANNLPALRTWYLPGAGQYLTNTANYLYNINQVVYNPQSTLLGPGNIFLQGDIALASLDTPAVNVPTWAILLSQLPQVTNINATTGTGYHVTIEGYGTNGSGQGGANGGIDYRRRVAENYLGILGSLDDIDSFLFGAPGGLPQNLYQVDFDSRRGSAIANQTSVYDFNVFRDASLPHEGITGPGDSGGPLILDRTFTTPVVIGVLSGGSRYYNAQASASYGTSSFYQPLYLFWDYIAANNFYHYVGAKQGDGNWTDPTHWVSLLDPSYQIIVNGQLVNGIPSTLGQGIVGTSGKFGDVCFDTATSSDCYNLATGVETYTVNGVTQTFIYTPGSGAPGTTPVPGATIANGLPGATNFVPNNNDPARPTVANPTGTNARYYDVTLGAAGTTTLSSTVRIDRFTILGAQSQLNVTTAGSLTSNIDFTQLSGLVTDNGTINVAGDYFMLLGGLQGSGRINSPFFTSVGGLIAPGTMGTIGTLTFGGNVILASGNTYAVDLGPNGTSDRIAVLATTFGANNAPTNGIANVGGRVGFAPAGNYIIRYNDLFTILTAQGGVTGTFAAPSALSAILTPRFIYNANSVQVTIDAGLYANVVNPNSTTQSAYAQLLDQNRNGNYSRLFNTFGFLDLQNAATIQSTLEALAPRVQTTRYALATTATDNMARFYRERVGGLSTEGLDGSVAVIGRPFEVASLNLSDMPGGTQVRTDAGTGTVQAGRLPEGVSGFLAGGYLEGHSRAMPTLVPSGRDEFNGFYVAGGIETEVGPHGVVGFGLSYTNLDGQPALASSDANGDLYQGTLYGKVRTNSGVTLDGVFSAGVFDSRTVRNVAIGPFTSRLTGNDHSLALSGEIGIGQAFDIASLTVTPRVAARASTVMFDQIDEDGGEPALRYASNPLNSYQGRAGLNIAGHGAFRPMVSAYYVHDFANRPGVFGANFEGGIGPNALFRTAGEDKDWGEASVGVGFHAGPLDLSVSADSTFFRTDVSNQAYRGAVTYHF